MVGNNRFGGLISQGAQQFSKMRLLSFSRDQEYQADVLGIRYMTAAGYDPNGGATMLGQLDPGNGARGADPGRPKPLDAGMGQYSPVEREPHGRRLANRAADRPGGQGCATAMLSWLSSTGRWSTTIRRRA